MRARDTEPGPPSVRRTGMGSVDRERTQGVLLPSQITNPKDPRGGVILARPAEVGGEHERRVTFRLCEPGSEGRPEAAVDKHPVEDHRGLFALGDLGPAGLSPRWTCRA